MRILVVGLNHKTAPVALRERVAFDAAGVARALGELRERFPQSEAVILSTCNRVELYVAGPAHGGPTADHVIDFLAAFHSVPRAELAESLYHFDHEKAVRHLFLVAGSLDSMVLGEYQIVNQVKEAWTTAGLAESTGKILNRLFTTAFEVAKKIRAETAIGQGKVSISSVAVDLVREIFSEFSDKTVLLLGAGKMSELTLRHLMGLGVAKILVCNRSPERGISLAGRYGAEAVPFDDLYGVLARADIVISGTGSREPVIRTAPFADVVARRRFRTMFLIDIAVPRDIEPGVGGHSNVYLYDIDDLNQIVARNIDGRTKEVERCQAIIDRHTAAFFAWFESRDLGPLIGRIREQFQAVCSAEMDRLKPKLTGDKAADWELIEQAFQRTVNKVLHVPTEQLKALARTGDPGLTAGLVRKLFGLEE